MSFIIDIPSELGDKNLAGFFTGWTWHDDPENPVILRIERGTHIAPHVQDLKKTLHLKFLLRSCSVSIFAAWFDGHFSPSKRQPIPDALLFPPTPDEPPLPITGTTRFRYFSPLSVWINRPPSASELPVFSSPATTGWPTSWYMESFLLLVQP